MARTNTLNSKSNRGKTALTVLFAAVALFYLMPIILVLINSFKDNAHVNTETFALPNSESFVGFANYEKGMTFGSYPFLKSVFYSLLITVISSALILICTSMAAWYISRVGTLFSKIVYYLCVFSMVVPFQMVMFNLAKTAERAVDDPDNLPRLRRGACGVHVLRLYKEHSARNRGSRGDRRLRSYPHVLLRRSPYAQAHAHFCRRA